MILAMKRLIDMLHWPFNNGSSRTTVGRVSSKTWCEKQKRLEKSQQIITQVVNGK